MNKPATIKDIARSLNISLFTVSRALRNAPDVNIDTSLVDGSIISVSSEIGKQSGAQ